MRRIGFIALAAGLAVFLSCSQLKTVQKPSDGVKGLELTEQESDSTEYEVIIFDSGFESWFIKNRKQPWYHTKESLENKNWLYVIAWNEKVRDSQFQMRNSNNPFEQEIDYRPEVDYGMDVNYKLYYYFKYVEDTWGKFL